MAAQEPRDHHYAPQFFLRNFAVDEEKKRITTVAKDGAFAVWAERSIQGIGYERDFYVHMSGSIPVSVETAINRRIETPISQSDTWTKIAMGRTDALDVSDKPILYALIRHLEARTPHYQATGNELAEMAEDPESDIPFTEEERRHFALVRTHPDYAKAIFNAIAATSAWTEQAYKGAGMAILRAPVALRSSTTPVLAIPAPPHPGVKLPLPGMKPYTLILTLNPSTILSVTLGDFDGAFLNREMDQPTARGINRHFVGQFGQFSQVRHLVTGKEGLIDEMAWARYTLVRNNDQSIVFRRQQT